MKWLPFLSILAILIFIGNGITGSYKESAHGNSTYGVKRLSGYSQGNCAHCHEMHAGNGSFTLFTNNFDTTVTTGLYFQENNFCFYCHGAGGITNYDYSKTFGGAPENVNTTNIMDAFNQASYHNLYDIWNFAKNNFDFFTSGSNPCVACHNPHIAKRNKVNPGDPTFTAISLPSDHGNLWGDDTSERMDKYNYQPPYCYNKTGFEPDCTNDTASTQASKTPDYIIFCTNCHDISTQIYSTTLGRNLRCIDWNNEIHGKGAADGVVNLENPYSTASGNKVVSCLDCHEPHGAPNLTLIRRIVNGRELENTITTLENSNCFNYDYDETKSKSIANLCDRCHQDDKEINSSCQENHWYIVHHQNDSTSPLYNPSKCGSCHSGGSGSGCNSEKSAINCNCCHYHGSTYDNKQTF